MRNDNVEAIIEAINQCKATISSSLHGIIISHAVQYPMPLVRIPGYIGGENNIKFSDYFLSVGIQPYDGIITWKIRD